MGAMILACDLEQNLADITAHGEKSILGQPGDLETVARAEIENPRAGIKLIDKLWCCAPPGKWIERSPGMVGAELPRIITGSRTRGSPDLIPMAAWLVKIKRLIVVVHLHAPFHPTQFYNK